MTAEEERDAAMRAVAASHKVWLANAVTIIKVVLAKLPTGTLITSEDLWPHLMTLVGTPLDKRALGPAMTKVAKAGFLKPTDMFIKGKTVSRHAAPIRQWEVV